MTLDWREAAKRAGVGIGSRSAAEGAVAGLGVASLSMAAALAMTAVL